MTIHNHEDQVQQTSDTHHSGAELIGPPQGAVNGYSIGIAIYFRDTYNEPGIHDDQEGFYVVEGTGQARVGDEEFDIRPGSAFMVAPGVLHSIKRDPASGPVKLVWSHGPVA